MLITASKVNAVVATAYNLHIGPKTNGRTMTPADAAKLSRGDRAALCRILESNGGSEIYTAADAARAFAFVVA